MRTLRYVLLACAVLFVVPDDRAEAQSTPRGTRVKSRIRLQLVDDGSKKPVVQVAVDSGTEFNTLAADRTFLATGPVVVTLRRFNPMSMAVTVTVNDADDPSNATVGTLVEKLLETATVLGAKVPSAPGTKGLVTMMSTQTEAALTASPATCTTEIERAEKTVKALDAALFAPIWGASSIVQKTASWTRAIESRFNAGQSGPAAVDAGRELVATFIGEATQPGTDQSPLDWATMNSSTLADALAKVNAVVKIIDDELAKRGPTECDKVAQQTYRLLRLTRPYERQHQFAQMVKAVTEIRDSLAAYANPARWSLADPVEFKAKDSIEPTSATLKNVSITFTSLTYAVAEPNPVLTVKKEDLTSAKLVVRRYLAWIPEIAVGLTYSNVDRPTYGTGKDDQGQTVIKEGPVDTSSIDPTVMVNFTCGFCGLSAITPMFQIGTSTSKSSPAIFVGGGFRLAQTPKGDFGLGVGFVLPFAKQLKSDATVGKVIDGTADLEKNLEWRRVSGAHPYVTIQYKF